MRFRLVLLAAACALLVGCNSQKQLVAEQARTIDSLFVSERTIRAELYALQDSIIFYEDIDSGLYFRQQRALEDRINRLEFLLAERAETLCVAEPIDTLLADDLFEPASAALTENGTARLAALAERIDTTYAGRRLRIEGHSDNVPLGAKLQERYPSNWELSAARAAAVARHFVAEHGFDPAQFDVVALGDTRPTASNQTAAGRRRNRRIGVLALPE